MCPYRIESQTSIDCTIAAQYQIHPRSMLHSSQHSIETMIGVSLATAQHRNHDWCFNCHGTASKPWLVSYSSQHSIETIVGFYLPQHSIETMDCVVLVAAQHRNHGRCLTHRSTASKPWSVFNSPQHRIEAIHDRCCIRRR